MSRIPCPCVCILLIAIAGGCATQPISPEKTNAVILVPGITGDGNVYAEALRSLHDHGNKDCLRVSDWGSSLPVFAISISSSAWHRNAETKLAAEILHWRKSHPDSRIALIAHSAGAGVVAGAVAQLPPGETVGPIIFLAPALSPGFDLRPMLTHATVLHVFFSEDDLFWQGIGPTIFGNYDGVHSSGAGRIGFTLSGLSADETSRIIQHPYQPKWKDLDNFGGHYDWMAQRFVAAELEPLIDALPLPKLIATGQGKSSAANPQ